MNATTRNPMMYKSAFFITRLFLCGAIILAIVLSGCSGSREIFEYSVNAHVGHPIKDFEKFVHKKVTLENGKTEYIFLNESGCSYAYLVNSDGVVESWRYVSDPALCKRGVNWGLF